MDEPSTQMYKRNHKVILNEFIYMNFGIGKIKLRKVETLGALGRDEVVVGRAQQGLLGDW